MACLTQDDIKKLIPHRAPFLFVDSVEEIIPGQRVSARLYISPDFEFFRGHFPSHPILPGVIMVEALAQVAGILASASLENHHRDQVVYFMSIEEARFRKPVLPGDTLRLEVQKVHNRGSIWKCAGQAYVGEQLVAEARLTAMIKSLVASKSEEI